MNAQHELSDEELLLASRMGDYKAEAALTERLYEDRVHSCYFVAHDAAILLDDWSLNEAFFRALISSVDGYRFQNVRFRTYFFKNLRHQIIHMTTKAVKERVNRGLAVSLDMPVESFGEDTYCSLADFVPSGDFMDDPRAFLDYAERLEDLHHLPAKADPVMLDVVRLVSSNYSIADAARICCLTAAKAKYLLARYREWVARSKRLMTSHRKKPPKGLVEAEAVD